MRLLIIRRQATSFLGTLVLFSNLLLMACTPASNSNLIKAHDDFNQAQSDPSMKMNATADLMAAGKILDKADQVWQSGQDTDETNHLIYLTERKLDLARSTAKQISSQKEFKDLSANRDQIRLAERDAEIAKLKAQKIANGILVTLGDVLFDTGKSTLKTGSEERLFPLVDYLKHHADTLVNIAGHTDSVGSKQYNYNLSQMRAEEVQDFLVSNGIALGRITAQGMGKDYPVVSNNTAAGRQQNRRVEVTITDAAKPNTSINNEDSQQPLVYLPLS